MKFIPYMLILLLAGAGIAQQQQRPSDELIDARTAALRAQRDRANDEAAILAAQVQVLSAQLQSAQAAAKACEEKKAEATP
jgi:uncharacterized protein YlxW (UPF0749 family)